MKGVILAAGKGTRMRELTKDRPKPMLEVAKRSILEYIFDAIKSAGITDLVVVTGYHANIIEDHFGDGREFGLKISYVRQEVQDGTGSALLLTEPLIKDEPHFFMTYGDIITSPENYPTFIHRFETRPCDAQLALSWVDDPWRGAAVYLEDDDRVVDIIEKPPKGTSKSNWNNAGLYVFRNIIYDYLKKIDLSPRGEYELTDAIRLMLKDGRDVRGVKLSGYWGDLATPEDIERMTKILEGKAG
jgi:dTDP-glucose pyrophosphorylase